MATGANQARNGKKDMQCWVLEVAFFLEELTSKKKLKNIQFEKFSY